MAVALDLDELRVGRIAETANDELSVDRVGNRLLGVIAVPRMIRTGDEDPGHGLILIFRARFEDRLVWQEIAGL